MRIIYDEYFVSDEQYYDATEGGYISIYDEEEYEPVWDYETEEEIEAQYQQYLEEQASGKYDYISEIPF